MHIALDIKSLHSLYDGGQTPSNILRVLYNLWLTAPNVFLYLQPLETLIARCAELEALPMSSRSSLWGIPFAVKDNVDVQGCPTTAACPAFSYVASETAPAIKALVEAGAIMVGKTNMDQFAAGLVGCRSPHGVAPCSFDPRFIPGGSSSGSAVAVGSGLVSFAIGSDTAGSGRVPAAFNGCVGIKPTPGSISIVGVVPACASLDCLSVLSRNVADGALVAQVMRQGQPKKAVDHHRRSPPPPLTGSVHHWQPGSRFKFGVPAPGYLQWGGGTAAAAAYQLEFDKAVTRLASLGGEPTVVDFSPMMAVAAMLYGSSLVAERVAGIRDFLGHGITAAQLAKDERLMPVTRDILSRALEFSAVDVFSDLYRLEELKPLVEKAIADVSVLLVPTALTQYMVEEIAEEEAAESPRWTRNAKLGTFTNFVNLCGMCGVSVPSGTVTLDYSNVDATGIESEEVKQRAQYLANGGGPMRATLAFGVTLLARAWSDEWLAALAAALHSAVGCGCGPKEHQGASLLAEGP